MGEWVILFPSVQLAYTVLFWKQWLLQLCNKVGSQEVHIPLLRTLSWLVVCEGPWQFPVHWTIGGFVSVQQAAESWTGSALTLGSIDASRSIVTYVQSSHSWNYKVSPFMWVFNFCQQCFVTFSELCSSVKFIPEYVIFVAAINRIIFLVLPQTALLVYSSLVDFCLLIFVPF